eukprot:TRINITY_DN21341_c0_g1_i1.p1 TRINITY_DN21341_c0_g1~~TRINITY_DN21341_c0_g1_i1.p1  ORF type:complete len:927 (+),score=264.93 TRINITY_DN21341_c0_g1_i1:55-2835(+)
MPSIADLHPSRQRRLSTRTQSTEANSDAPPEERPDFPCAPDLGEEARRDSRRSSDCPTPMAAAREAVRRADAREEEEKAEGSLGPITPASPIENLMSVSPMRLTSAVLGRRRSVIRSSLAFGPGGARGARGRQSGAGAMYEIIKKAKEERDKQKKRGRRTYTVLHRSQETMEHLESALESKSLSPDAAWRRWWDVSVLLCIAFYWFMVPLGYVVDRDAFFVPEAVLNSLEGLCTVILIVDIALRFRTGFIEVTAGLVVDDPVQIRDAYLLGDFAWDLLAGIPLDSFVLFFGGSSYRNLHHAAQHLRLFKVFRIRSLFQVMNTMKLDKNLVNFQFNVVPNVKMAFYTVLGVHVCTVLFMAMNTESAEPHETNTTGFSYTTSMYWTLYTVTSVGYGDVPVDSPWKKRFASVLLLAGVVVHGVCMTEIAERRAKADVRSEMRDKMRETLNVMTLFNIPEELQHEVLAFQYHQLHSSVSGAFVKVLESLPLSMRTRVGLYVRVKFICMVPMFSDQSIDCLVDLANALQNLVFEPEQKIIRCGEEGKEMFFLGHGFADVLAATGEFVTVIKPGGFFGEVALLTESKRTATIKSLTYCDTFRLTKDKFLEILEKHASLRMAVEEEMRKRNIKAAPGSPLSPAEEKKEEGGEPGDEDDQKRPAPVSPCDDSSLFSPPAPSAAGDTASCGAFQTVAEGTRILSAPTPISPLLPVKMLSDPLMAKPLTEMRAGSATSLLSLRSNGSATSATEQPAKGFSTASERRARPVVAPTPVSLGGSESPPAPPETKLSAARRQTLPAKVPLGPGPTSPVGAGRRETIGAQQRSALFGGGITEQRLRRYEDRLDDLAGVVQRVEEALSRQLKAKASSPQRSRSLALPSSPLLSRRESRPPAGLASAAGSLGRLSDSRKTLLPPLQMTAAASRDSLPAGPAGT